MKIKAAEIARQLGISKATVSLALNNKPGVSNETKKQILQYIDRVENGIIANNEQNIIKILCFSKQIKVAYHAEVDLWSGVLTEFSQEAKKDGFVIGIDYIGDTDMGIEQAISNCNQEQVAGVVLFATEMVLSDFKPFKKINKPMVIYDNDFDDGNYSYIMIDNYHGLEKIITYLIDTNYNQITYLANAGDNYNFRERRYAFMDITRKMGIKGNLVVSGDDVESSYLKIKDDLINKQYHKAIICENYQISIGAIKAIQELGLKINQDIVIIGIDEIPDYFCYGNKLTALKVSHNQRAFMAMILLKQEILNQQSDKFRIYSSCEFIKGDTA